jgi:hypothetical protein
MPNINPTVAASWTPYQWEVFNAFNDSAYVRDQMDVQQTPLYDQIVIAAGSALTVTTSAFFTNVGANANKNIAQTNLTRANELISPEAFSIKQFRLRWSENVLRVDLTSILGNSTTGFVFEFYIGKKPYMQVPIWMLPAGGGIFGFSDLTGESCYTNGWPSSSAARSIALPLVISSKASFQGQLNGPSYTLNSGGTGLTMMCVLEGFYARGVQ